MEFNLFIKNIIIVGLEMSKNKQDVKPRVCDFFTVHKSFGTYAIKNPPLRFYNNTKVYYYEWYEL